MQPNENSCSPQQIEAAKPQVLKALCFVSTLFFTRYMFRGLYNRSFVVGRHHEVICEALDRVFSGQCKRLIINIGPRYGKTEVAVKNLIAKGFGVNPKAKFIHLSYSQSLALDNSKGVKEILKSPRYQELYPEVQIRKDSDAAHIWYTTAGGGVYAAAAGGQVTGFGAGLVDHEKPNLGYTEQQPIPDEWFTEQEKFGGAIIIDDPIKPEDANYETKRTNVNDRFDSTIVNRVNSRNTPIIIIMQRVHEEDLAGHVMENYEGWEVISLPAINEDGTALWPFKHTIEELLEQREENEFVFDTQMMQDPKPKHGRLFPKGELREFSPDPNRKFDSSIGYVDVADEGDDFTSAPVGCNVGKDIYITDVVFTQLNTDHSVPMCAEMYNQWKTEYVRVEANNMGAWFGRDLGKTINGTVYPATSTTNKHTRITMAAGFIIKHCLFLKKEHRSKEYQAFMDNLHAYQKAGKVKHDDAPDSVSGLVNFIRSILSHIYN